MILCVCPNPSIDTYYWLNDLFPGTSNRVIKQNQYPGGKGVHVGFALNELGEQAGILGFWAGVNGTWIKEKCAEKKISCFGPDVIGASRKCITLVTKQGDSDFNNTELLETGPSISKEDFDLFNIQFQKMVLQIDFLCLSGSWPIGAPQDAYRDLILQATKSDKKVILDASGAQLENALKAKPFGLHLNLEEAKFLYQTDDCQSILQDLGEKVELVALTAGKKGLYLLYKGIFIQANVHIPKVISSVGSGDSLTAGIAYALHQEMSPKDIARWGVACGAANCLREDLGMFYREDVFNLLKEVTIKN